MATWNLSPQHKKSAVEMMFFYKGGKRILIEQGFRWANFKITSDVRPLTDEELKNEDEYDLGVCIDNDESWEMWDMTDGCWLDIRKHSDDVTDEELEAFEEAWEEDSYEGVEALGWSNDDTEYYFYGPLELTNEDTGEVFKGEPDEVLPVPEAPDLTFEEKVELVKEMEAEVRAEQAQGAKWPFSPPSDMVEEVESVEGHTDLTEWYHKDHYYPTQPGRYQVTSYNSINWPFPTFAVWDGKKWSDDKVISWRGLNNDPNQ